MANTRSSKKANRVSSRRNLVNVRIKKEFKEARKAVLDLLKSGKYAEAKKAMPKAYSKIDFAAKKKLIHNNTASRYKSRLAQQVKKAAK